MVCYARPASWLVAILTVSWLVFSGPVSHFFGTAAVIVAVLAAAAGAAVAAALAVASFTSTRRRRAAAGGCVNCRFRCQHAMTAPARRFRLVTAADRRPQAPAPGHPGRAGRPGGAPSRSVPVLLPVPAVRPAGPGTPSLPGGAAPRWPDRPLHRTAPHRTAPHRTGQPARPGGHAPQRERAGSPALTAPAGPGSVALPAAGARGGPRQVRRRDPVPCDIRSAKREERAWNKQHRRRDGGRSAG